MAAEKESAMFGFIVGTISLVALIKVVRRGRHGGWRGGGGRGWIDRRRRRRIGEAVRTRALDRVRVAVFVERFARAVGFSDPRATSGA